jgi:steroid 5-alpha reductase family enzyme
MGRSARGFSFNRNLFHCVKIWIMNYYLTLALVLFGYMNLWFVFSLVKKRNDVADVAWGPGFVVVAWASFFIASNFGIRGLLVNTLVSVWGLRLAWHIHSRNKGKTEDYRYLAWRKEWGKWFYLRSYVQVYLLQGFLLYLIALPILVVNASFSASLGFLDALGVLVWIIGFAFEVVGDAELAQFIKDPVNKGKLMQSGLWAYTRHPNYFGEVTLWWGIWLLSFSSPYAWFVIIGPITITFLILKVSGIPMLEKKMAEHPDFAEYERRVSVFLPLPPKKYI